MNTLRDRLRDSEPGKIYRRYRERLTRGRARKLLARTAELQAHGIRFDVEGIDLTLKEHIKEGGYESTEVAACKKHLTRQDRVLEIGAAIGFVGLYCRKNIGIEQYTSVECNPETLRRLHRNYELNGLKADSRPWALAAKDEDLTFHFSPLFWSDSALVKNEASQKITVPGRKLASILESLPVEPTALILDVEGSEIVLADTKFPASLRIIIIELHPNFVGMEQTGRLATNWIRQGFALADFMGPVFVFRRD